ncbi:arabinan endo-1,5-alpha-L-arabinosidase [Nocardiopsis chromatogenes]|uniref:arabinan endo-1,5-alpha-L-arabinosidase n=1 Tax=Nocardiopsis chromatogenes TaxID=280239 RepID=UPI00034BA4DD|nr:arabinan endo-1,5-alpha-L-arabinosidase [Nocardiopsis chromatogenes]
MPRTRTPMAAAAAAAALAALAACTPAPQAATVSAVSADSAAPPPPLTGDTGVHDPGLVAGGPGEDWYVFGTGDADIGDGNIRMFASPNGSHWQETDTVWDTKPAWLAQEIPGVENLWAPEVYEHDGTYYLYYSASTFGSQRSLIALATNTTLDPDDPDYRWVDRGKVFESHEGDPYNAIDPGIVEGADGSPWMAFGSHWGGIYMVPLAWPDGKVADGAEPFKIADRQEGANRIEAPSIAEHGGDYYLYVSFDACCQGTDSTYKIAVGRADEPTGPYTDADGVPMTEGGGTVILADRGGDVAAGGQSLSEGHIAYHTYGPYGTPGDFRLGIEPVRWTGDGWPVLAH